NYTAIATDIAGEGDSPLGYSSLDYFPQAAGGQQFTVSLFYHDPANEPVSGYSVPWDDGTTASGSGTDFTHSFAYDPTSGADNVHSFTVTAHSEDDGDYAFTN